MSMMIIRITAMDIDDDEAIEIKKRVDDLVKDYETEMTVDFNLRPTLSPVTMPPMPKPA